MYKEKLYALLKSLGIEDAEETMKMELPYFAQIGVQFKTLMEAGNQSNDAAQDSEGRAVLEGVDYYVNNVDSDTISLTRCQ